MSFHYGFLNLEHLCFSPFRQCGIKVKIVHLKLTMPYFVLILPISEVFCDNIESSLFVRESKVTNVTNP